MRGILTLSLVLLASLSVATAPGAAGPDNGSTGGGGGHGHGIDCAASGGGSLTSASSMATQVPLTWTSTEYETEFAELNIPCDAQTTLLTISREFHGIDLQDSFVILRDAQGHTVGDARFHGSQGSLLGSSIEYQDIFVTGLPAGAYLLAYETGAYDRANVHWLKVTFEAQW